MLLMISNFGAWLFPIYSCQYERILSNLFRNVVSVIWQLKPGQWTRRRTTQPPCLTIRGSQLLSWLKRDPNWQGISRKSMTVCDNQELSTLGSTSTSRWEVNPTPFELTRSYKSILCAEGTFVVFCTRITYASGQLLRASKGVPPTQPLPGSRPTSHIRLHGVLEALPHFPVAPWAQRIAQSAAPWRQPTTLQAGQSCQPNHELQGPG